MHWPGCFEHPWVRIDQDYLLLVHSKTMNGPLVYWLSFFFRRECESCVHLLHHDCHRTSTNDKVWILCSRVLCDTALIFSTNASLTLALHVLPTSSRLTTTHPFYLRHTLYFGSLAKNVINHAEINETVTDSDTMLVQYQSHVQSLQDKLESIERDKKVQIMYRKLIYRSSLFINWTKFLQGQCTSSFCFWC